jgi:uncharacterized membrane protein/protein-disulfide isomerase
MRDLGLAVLVLALAGLAINVFLLSRQAADAGAAISGCGGGDCGEVLASRWSTVFRLPVTVFGVIAHLGLIASLLPVFARSNVAFLGMIAASAVWFLFVQWVLVGRFCQWCLIAHGVAILMFALGAYRLLLMRTAGGLLRWAVGGFLAIGLAQVYGPVADRHRVDQLPEVSHQAPSDDDIWLPRLGAASAEHVIVELYDYQCSACVKMASYLEALVAKHPDRVAVILQPVPLEVSCNPGLAKAIEHPGSCAITRVALAVWRARPEKFPVFHKELLSMGATEINADRAEILAANHLGGGDISALMNDPWIDERIRDSVANWRMLSMNTPKLPKLVIRGKRVLHGLPPDEKEFLRVMEQELGL